MLYEFDHQEIEAHLNPVLRVFHPEVKEEETADAGTAATFQKALAALPEPENAVVRMAFCLGLSHREIARETGLPINVIKTRLEAGAKMLRGAVLDQGPQGEMFPDAA